MKRFFARKVNPRLTGLILFLILGTVACGPLTTDPPDITPGSPSGQTGATQAGRSTPNVYQPPQDQAYPLPASTAALETVDQAAIFTVEPELTATPAPATPTATGRPFVRFAAIGDYGGGGQAEQDVADLINGWNPDFIVTLGDNNYPDGAAETIDQNIGQFFHTYIYDYQGQYGPGSETSRFFPTLGNHDWTTNKAQPYLDYFNLPGNERYFDLIWGPVHIFALDSDSREPDGVSRISPQAQWLEQKLAESESPWKLVLMHAPPYSSGMEGSVDWMQWPYQEWGADAVLSGHDHTYERLIIDGFPYFVNGLGGGAIYYFLEPLAGSQARYSADYGAMLITANDREILFEFYTRGGELVDSYQMQK